MHEQLVSLYQIQVLSLILVLVFSPLKLETKICRA
jgi:hypothetical protein